VVGHIIYRNELVLLPGNNAGDVLLQFIIMLPGDEALPSLNGEYNMKVYLGVGVCHAYEYATPTEFGKYFLAGFYKDVAPPVLSLVWPLYTPCRLKTHPWWHPQAPEAPY